MEWAVLHVVNIYFFVYFSFYHHFLLLLHQLSMKTLRNTLAIALLTTIPTVAKAQNVSYTYDAAGNRIKREIVMSRQQSPTRSAKTEEQESFSEMLAQKQIKIHPNPTSGLLKVEVLGLEPDDVCQLRLFTASGQQIINREATSSTTSLDISSRPNGVYLLRISIGKDETTWKIIKK